MLINNDNLINYINTSSIRRVKINGLFGTNNIDITFDSSVNIFVGENGLGKTTILSCIYFLLTGNLEKLYEINFKSIAVFFYDDEKEYKVYNKVYNKLYDKKLISQNFKYYENYQRSLRNALAHGDDNLIRIYLNRFNEKNKNYIIGINETIEANIKRIEEIKNKIKERILYLPTYRRIEANLDSELLHDLSIYDTEDFLIKFGMDDVKELIDKTIDKIRKSAIDGFNEMNSILLTEYTNNKYKNKISENEFNYNEIEVLLNKIGVKINPKTKNEILRLIKTKEIYNSEYIYLKNFLNLLYNNSEKQRVFDHRLIDFVNLCNKYFINKEIVYDPNTLKLDLYLVNKKSNSNKKIKFSELSSGEKQIVSIFSKLYLEKIDTDQKFIVIIDEPELSLSLNWQEKLLPDIMNTNKCSLIITVTHSPFIFRNKFDGFAKDIKKFIKINGDIIND